MAFVWLFIALAVSRTEPALGSCSEGVKAGLEVVFSWGPSELDFAWPNATFRQDAVRQNFGSARFGPPVGVEVFGDSVYVTIPRWNRVGYRPVNVAVVGRPDDSCGRGGSNGNQAVLRAYPNHAMQRVDDCLAFQFVQNLEVDPRGILWLPDNGYVGWKGVSCPPKMVLLDSRTNEVVKTHVFPRAVVSRGKGSFLNDIAVDADDQVAFVSDSKAGKIIVYDSRRDRSWSVQHSSMFADNAKASRFELPRTFFIRDNHVNGIALTPAASGERRDKYLVFSPLTSYSLFYARARDLKENVQNDSTFGELMVRKRSQSDGMIMDNRGRLYFSGVTLNALYFMDTFEEGTRKFPKNGLAIEMIVRDNTSLVWPDSFSIDNDGDFVWATTRGWPLDGNRNYLVRVPINRRKPYSFS